MVFVASDNTKLGKNPDEIRQLFSIDMLGGDLRQLTNFRDPSRRCRATAPIFDPASRTIVFRVNCDPFGTNASGDQAFAIRPDGTGLRQLTTASGYTTEPDGTVHVELVSDYGIPTGRQK